MTKDHHKPKRKVEKRLLKVQRVVGENVEQKTFETKVKLPVAAIKVMDVLATLERVRSEVKEDGVMVKGIIHQQIFYVDQGNLVRHLAEDTPFRIFVDVEGADEDMRAHVDASIEDVSWSVVHHGMAVKDDIVVRVFAKVTETEQVEVVTGVHGVDVVTDLLRVESVVGEDTVRETINPTVDLPVPAIKIFDIQAEVQDVTYEVKKDTVLIRGTVHKQVFYVDKTNVVRHFPEDVSFTLGVDIPGATPKMDAQVDVDVLVDDWKIVGMDDHKGGHGHKDHHRPPHKDKYHHAEKDHYRTHGAHQPPHPPMPDHPMPDHRHGQTLRQTLVLEAFVKVIEPLQLDVVVDVPSCKVEKMLLKVDEVVAHAKETETIDAEVTLPMDAIKVYSINACIRRLRYEIRDGNVVVRGVIHKQIFYVDRANLLRHFPEDISFSIPVNVPEAEEDMRAHVRAKIVGDVDWTLRRRGNVVMQTVLVAVDVKVTQEKQIEVVTDVHCHGGGDPGHGHCPRNSRPYIVKPGDTLFTIAQDHSVSVDAILRVNPEIRNPNMIDVGMRICIPERKHWKG